MFSSCPKTLTAPLIDMKNSSHSDHAIRLAKSVNGTTGPQKPKADGRSRNDFDISSLLNRLQVMTEAVTSDPMPRPPQSARSGSNQLTAARLGHANALFYALRAKHAATAAHGLRVALICSAWAERLKLNQATQTRIEIAALLHDLGKIGIPDRILRKPGKLTAEESQLMATSPELGCEILSGCTDDQGILEIILHARAWYSGPRAKAKLKGEAIPFGARMLAIADAFDAMTTEQVYRPAMSLDRALADLIQGANTQFDGNLVRDFHRLLEASPEILQGTVAQRWLLELRPEDSAAYWTGAASSNKTAKSKASSLQTTDRQSTFNQRLLATLKDGIIYTDNAGTVLQWNRGMERLSGKSAEAMVGKLFTGETVGLVDDDQSFPECPMTECLRTTHPVHRKMILDRDTHKDTTVHVDVTPVMNKEAGLSGTLIVIRDQSDQVHLEEQLHVLHEENRLDPLTRVSNRGHFDKRLEELVAMNVDGESTFSLIICDLDHFKSVNDRFGHPGGDAALIEFADLLRQHRHEGDLVARYGGEEFLLLAVDCDNATAARRAEEIRQSLQELPIAALEQETLTASFGVTEFQSGDSPETIVARADRALIKAKDNGRNRVVQLGLGKMSEFNGNHDEERRGFFNKTSGSDKLIVDLVTPVPADMTIEKLRGFIADHHADIIDVAESQVTLAVQASKYSGGRRKVDQRINFQIRMTLSEAHLDEVKGLGGGRCEYTKVHVELGPKRGRDRRKRDYKLAANYLLASIKCYLMADTIGPSE